MILVRLQGGLGNQMFQYAFGRMLALKNKTELKLDLTLLKDRSPSENAVFRNFDLDIFNLIPSFATEKEVTFYNGYPNGTLFKKTLFKFSGMVNPRNLIIQKKHEFMEQHLNLPVNSCLVGRWQSHLYFKNFQKDILNDFSINDSDLLNSSFKHEILNQENAIAVHIRRGDYVNNSFYKANIGALDISYYESAFNYICKNVNNPVFYVFSDDMDWCMQNMNFLPSITFVKSEKSKKGMAEDLKLISLCKHHIISNSTFSWWGAYLCTNKHKIVIAPQKWALNPDFIPPHILVNDWKII